MVPELPRSSAQTCAWRNGSQGWRIPEIGINSRIGFLDPRQRHVVTVPRAPKCAWFVWVIIGARRNRPMACRVWLKSVEPGRANRGDRAPYSYYRPVEWNQAAPVLRRVAFLRVADWRSVWRSMAGLGSIGRRCFFASRLASSWLISVLCLPRRFVY